MRSIFWGLMTLLFLSHCDKDDDPVAELTSDGSCLKDEIKQCTDLSGPTATVEQQKTGCTDADGVWSDELCDVDKGTKGCKLSNPALPDLNTTIWFLVDLTTDAASEQCEALAKDPVTTEVVTKS